MTPVKVETRHLTKQFKMYERPNHRLREWLTLGRDKRHRLFTALDDITFTVRQGEFFGIIGPNGSGKSTLLKILTRVLWPTAGGFDIHGRVTSLLELGTGFHPELTGRENILNSARILGFDEGYVRGRLEAMIDFADIGTYIDQPIKYYSSGMLVRLAFAIFSHVEPDVFIVDEALSVGDVYFSQKCFQRLDQMREAGCTLLFVTHDMAAVRKYCDQALYLHQGACRYLGPAQDTTDVYLAAMSPGGVARKLAPEDDGRRMVEIDDEQVQQEAVAERQKLPSDLAEVFDEAAFEMVLRYAGSRIGTGAVRIRAVRVCDDQGQTRSRFTLDERIHVHVLARVRDDVERATTSIQATNRMGLVVWGTNHELLSGEVLRLEAQTWSYTHFIIHPGLGSDEFTLDVAYGDASGEGHVFDRLTAVTNVEVAAEGRLRFVGLAHVPCESTVTAHR